VFGSYNLAADLWQAHGVSRGTVKINDHDTPALVVPEEEEKSGQRGTNQLVSQAAFPTMMYQVSSEGGTTTGSNGQRDGCNVVN